jgi:predicted MFS family arabinose efflux permease
MTALLYGVVGSVYWLLGVEAISSAGGMGQHTAALFWTVIGAAGTIGIGAGVVFARLGLHMSHVLLFGSLALAVALLGVAPGAPPTVLTSALLYGPAFMAGSALLAVWSYEVFPDRPTTGFSATVLFLGLGTIVAPASAGAIADRHGLSSALLATAAVAAATLLVAPRRRVAAER